MIDPAQLLQGYASGIFPMADSKEGEINWYSADPRGYIDLNDFQEFKLPKRIMRYINNMDYVIKVDTCFEEVMRECATRPRDENTWISEEMIVSYVNLHHLGFAHSIEVFVKENLVGGLYGVSLRGAFFGESMFNRVSNASKIALYYLIQRLLEKKYRQVKLIFGY